MSAPANLPLANRLHSGRLARLARNVRRGELSEQDRIEIAAALRVASDAEVAYRRAQGFGRDEALSFATLLVPHHDGATSTLMGALARAVEDHHG